MKNLLKKPLKDWNLIDMGIASIGALGLIPVGFFIFCKGFDALETLDSKHKVKLSELENDDEPIMTTDEEETE